ncbi:MAG: hypothetical protein ACR2GY_07675 [Phycisphaerales bacterium]
MSIPLPSRSLLLRALSPAACGVVALVLSVPLAAQEEEVVKQLNFNIQNTRVTENNKSYRTLFDAALDLTAAPSQSGKADGWFNLNTISPSMPDWDKTRDWAETNAQMRNALLACRDRLLIGLPYGAGIDEKYRAGGMYADVAVDGNLRVQDFAYLQAMDTIAAYATAECHRLAEAGRAGDALELAYAEIYVLDQLMKQQYQVEVLHGMELLTDFLAVLRDLMYTHFDAFSLNEFVSDGYDGPDGKARKGISYELPYLRIDLLELPKGDYISAKALVDEAFGGADRADEDRFASMYARIQADERPLTQFGAARRWRLVARVHGSYRATDDQLRIVFEDWQRRWGIRAWHQYLDLRPQYDRTNPVRYAAVTYSMRNINEIFPARRELIAAVNGTALAAALCGYRKQFGKYPDDLEKVYAVFIRKRQDVDPYDKNGRGFGYRYVSGSTGIVVQGLDDFVSVKDSGLLWARGLDYTSNRGETHSEDGLIGDIVFWPPFRALAREQGLLN